KLVRSGSSRSTLHAALSGAPGSTATACQVKSIHWEAALLRSTTTPTGMRTSAAISCPRLFEWQAGDEVLRLEAQHVVGARGKDQIDGLFLQSGHHAGRFAEDQPIEPDDARALRVVEFLALPQRVADFRPFGV